MGCSSSNATAPTPAVAPGAEDIDVEALAPGMGERWAASADRPGHPASLVGGFDAPFFQAGLAGYSDAAMRIVARRHGCPMCVTEALLDRTLLAGGRGFAKADLGEIENNVPGGAEDRPLVGQIMGSQPAEMAAAAVKMVEQGRRQNREYREMALGRSARRADEGRIGDSEKTSTRSVDLHGRTDLPAVDLSFAGIDVNLACPVKKISRKARGGHWLAEPDGAIAILQGVRDAVPDEIPVSVKLRRSFDDSPQMGKNFQRIADAAFAMGCAWITVHGRTVAQKYVGPSRWDLLRAIVRANPGRPIFGSGDLWSAGDLFRMLAYTGVAAVGVARGCIGNPWIFRQAREMMAGRQPTTPTIAEQREVLMQHFELALAVNAGMRQVEYHTAKAMRKFGIRFSAHHPESERVRRRMIAVENLEDWRGVLDDFYSSDASSGEERPWRKPGPA